MTVGERPEVGRVLALTTEEGAPEPRDAGVPGGLGKARQWVLSWGLREEPALPTPFRLVSSVRLVTYRKVVSVRSLKPLGLRGFVRAAVKKRHESQFVNHLFIFFKVSFDEQELLFYIKRFTNLFLSYSMLLCLV